MKNKIKFFTAAIACVLIAAFTINQLSDIISYAVEDSLYIASLKVFTAPTKDEAVKNCKNAGYYYADANLNTGNEADAVVLGYTVTSDPEEAVTDVSVLEMNSGYEEFDYADIREREIEKMGAVTSAFMASINEYKNNIEKNSPAALEAKETLNLFFIPEMDNIGLGDYLAGENCTEDFIKKLICQSNSGISYAMFCSMASGVADYKTENWAQKVSKSEVQGKLALGGYGKQLDCAYKEYAMDIRSQLQDFYQIYTEAANYVEKNGMQSLSKDAQKVDDYEVPEETVEKISECEEFTNKDSYALYLIAYDILNQYKYDAQTRLGDYILEMGSKDFATNEELRMIYPLVDALSYGQIGVLRITGIPQMAMSLINNRDVLENAKEYITGIREKIKEMTNGAGNSISVWSGIDQKIYNSKVVLTTSAKRATYSADEFTELTKEDNFDKKLDEILSAAYVTSAMIGCAVFVTTVGVNIAAIAGVGFSAWFAGASVSVWGVCFNAATAVGSSILTSMLGCLGCVIVAMSYVILAVIAVVLVVMLVKWLYDYFSDEEDTVEYTLDSIPLTVYDYIEEKGYIKYDVIKNAKYDKGADINAEKGRRFIALYSTTQKNAGEPIKVNDAGETFRLISNNSAAPDGYESVRYFGNGSSADLNAYSKNNEAPSIYLSYYVQAVEKSEEAAEADDTQDETEDTQTTGTNRYISNLCVSVQKTETAAKAELKKSGFTPIDKNLTEFLGGKNGYYTYLGYKTSSVRKDAVTDIRVLPRDYRNSDSFALGDSQYLKAGVSTPAGAGIYYSRSSLAGTPVYDDIQIVSDKKQAKAGYEPVIMFNGGDAYNFNEVDNTSLNPNSLSNKNWGKGKTYIYFRPEKTFTSGPEYISGLTFFTGRNSTKTAGDEMKQYAESYGYKIYNADFTKDYSMKIGFYAGMDDSYVIEKVKDVVTYLGYSTTHNPYRAIYSVKSYTAMPDVSYLSPILITGGRAYAACSVFYQLCRNIHFDNEPLALFNRGVLLSNSYNAISNAAAPNELPDVIFSVKQRKEDYESVSWSESDPRIKGLYVTGNAEGLSPLTVSDISVVSGLKDETALNEKGMYSVQDARTPNREKAHNLAFSSENPVYIFIKGQKPEEKKYISSISVASWDSRSYVNNDEEYDDMSSSELKKINKNADESCIFSLLPSCTDEVIQKNLAVNYNSSRQKSLDNVPTQASFIGVSRTDDSVNAVRSIIKYKPNGAKTTEKITVEGIEYIRAGESPVHDSSGDYYIYYSTNSGCAPGEPITSVDFSSVPLVKDCATALTATETDVKEIKVGTTVKIKGKTAALKGYSGEANYIHSAFETNKSQICDIYIGEGKTQSDAMLDLMNMGCNMFVNVDMNKLADGRYIYLGYDKLCPDDGFSDMGVRDIICTVGHKASATIEHNGLTYKRARDRYIMANDTSKAVSFNEGTNGLSIYLYYTCESSPSAESPIMNLAAAQKDFVPDNKGQLIWENVMTTSGRRCNFNDGVYASSSGYSTDTRIYLFANRLDNSVRDGARVFGGSTAETMKYGKLKLS